MLNAGFTSLWQPRQSCGSPVFCMRIVAKPGFSWFTGLISTFEPGLFFATWSVRCGEWQSVQPISLRQCSPRRKLLCSSRPARQARQASDVSFGDLFLNEIIFAGSPSSAWALPGPWQDSQPVTFPFQLLIVARAACDV